MLNRPPRVERRAQWETTFPPVVVPRRSLLPSVWQNWLIFDVVAQSGTQLICPMRQDLVD
jgi:hypothetical protein